MTRRIHVEPTGCIQFGGTRRKTRIPTRNPQAERDLKRYHGVDLKAEIVMALVSEIEREIEEGSEILMDFEEKKLALVDLTMVL